MPRRGWSWPRRAAAMLAAVMIACTTTPEGGSSPTPAGSGTSSPVPTSSPSVSQATSDDPVEAAATLLRLTPPRGGSFLVRGRYPFVPTRCRDAERPTLTGRFPGTLHVRRSDDGTMTVTVALPFDRYLEGIAEVPPSWPMAALEAQAIAARSYALATTGWSGDEGQTLDQPICATTSCQVYRGIPVPPDPTHRRWVRAVRRTDGEVLLHEGRPATTVYFSTSNGRTYANEDVFGSSPLPVPATGQRARRRRVADVALAGRAAVRRPHRLPAGRRALAARPGDLRGADARPSLVLRGGGERRSIDAGDLRDAVNTWAPCLRPGRYPPETAKGALPLTVPSRWSHLTSTERAVVVTGRGWGHGAGMVQWGAYGKARRGFSASDILAFYYGGLRPQRAPEPGLIRVLVASGLTVLRISPSGPGGKIGSRLLDRGAVVISGGDRLEVRD